jgi:hypothetical protein
MADHNKTLSNSLNLFGGGGASLWNAYNWGSFKWGEGTVAFPQDVLHLVSSSLAPTSDASSLQPVHYLDGGSFSFDTTPLKRGTRVLTSETLTLSGETTSEQLGDGSGYYYVYVSNTTNSEDKDETSWSGVAAGSASWTTATVTSVSWS